MKTRAAEPAARVARVVRGVVSAAVREAAAGGVVVLEDWTPEGELLYEWLVAELGEARVWRAASLSSNVQGARAPRPLSAEPGGGFADALSAHPVNKTALLLGGRVPHADLLPLGDLWASQVEALVGRWSAGPEVEALATSAGGVGELDAALRALVEDRGSADSSGLPAAVVASLLRLYERGRFYRLRPRLVPKLTVRTLGIDLFD